MEICATALFVSDWKARPSVFVSLSARLIMSAPCPAVTVPRGSSSRRSKTAWRMSPSVRVATVIESMACAKLAAAPSNVSAPSPATIHSTARNRPTGSPSTNASGSASAPPVTADRRALRSAARSGSAAARSPRMFSITGTSASRPAPRLPAETKAMSSAPTRRHR